MCQEDYELGSGRDPSSSFDEYGLDYWWEDLADDDRLYQEQIEIVPGVTLNGKPIPREYET